MLSQITIIKLKVNFKKLVLLKVSITVFPQISTMDTYFEINIGKKGDGDALIRGGSLFQT